MSSILHEHQGITYKVRASRKARHLRIKIHPVHGVQVIKPAGMPNKQVCLFIEEQRSWINRHYEIVNNQLPSIKPPVRISLLAGDRTINVQYRHSVYKSGYRIPDSNNDLLTIYYYSNQNMGYVSPLNRWLRNQAKTYLQSRLEALNHKTGITHSRFTVRSQKTRWGSCSAKHNINLNDRLLFLPVKVSDYVLIHELCHIQHMNHSPAFWHLVERFSPDYMQIRKELKQASTFIPDWAKYL